MKIDIYTLRILRGVFYLLRDDIHDFAYVTFLRVTVTFEKNFVTYKVKSLINQGFEVQMCRDILPITISLITKCNLFVYEMYQCERIWLHLEKHL